MKISGNSAEQRNRYHSDKMSNNVEAHTSDEVKPLLNLRQGETYIRTDHRTGRHTKQGDGGHNHETIARNTNNGDRERRYRALCRPDHCLGDFITKSRVCRRTVAYDCSDCNEGDGCGSEGSRRTRHA